MAQPRCKQDGENRGVKSFTKIDLKTLRRAIPPSCFEPSLVLSLMYLFRDILYSVLLLHLTLTIPNIKQDLIRIFAWLGYGFLQGCVWTGIWIIGHECGHGAFSKNTQLNDIVGWIVHSFLLVPYFAWKITHARHHRYTGHIEKDVVYVPLTESDMNARSDRKYNRMLSFLEETPIMTVIQLVGRQLVGWQLYLCLNLTAGKKSASMGPGRDFLTNSSHFDPCSTLFTLAQQPLIFRSNIGLCITIAALSWIGAQSGWFTVALVYFMPYLWVHHWIVAITYLHHTHPSVPHYAEGTWTFTSGALCTIDRSFGIIGRHFFHDIIDYHVIHHLFPKIPFYKAQEATEAVRPILGEQYRDEKECSFLWSLFDTFRRCNFVSNELTHNGTYTGVLNWAKTKKL